MRHTLGVNGQEESATEEVSRVVELVLEHARTRPDETLGVITMGIRHALRIEAALDDALRRHANLEPFFSMTRDEPFFVKNLERVQGDERDVIILSIGYGKDRTGRLLYRFGPLLTQGGERRLNVAITRARQRLTLVSSFDHHDMDPNRSKARGVELLRSYLQYMASNGALLDDTYASDVPLNPFEADVHDMLTTHGIPLIPQLGVSGYRIDLAAQHPEKPGQFVLAIECDGASYHSSPTARDRDRLRQQHLEALGWRFHRIWSTDWFTRRESEVQRAVAAFNVAVQQSNHVSFNGNQPITSDPPPKQANNGALTTATPKRAERPSIPAGFPIDDYELSELQRLVRWIESDGKLRTNNEIIEEMMRELGFRRRGAKIVARIEQAIAAVRQTKKN